MSRRAWMVATATGAVIALAAWAAWPQSRSDVLWISVESLRRDHLTAYGGTGARTRNIDYLAANGVLFEQAFTDAPWTTAAMASALSGEGVLRHGLRTPFARLPANVVLIAERMRDAGYDTAAVVGSYALARDYGLARGFAHYDDRQDSPVFTARQQPHMPNRVLADVDSQRRYMDRKRRADWYRSDAAVADAAVGWLQRASRHRPFFLWVHFFGPHLRQEPGDTPGVAGPREAARYDARLAQLDVQIGRLLEELRSRGSLERTLILLHADHAESLLEHGEVGHGDSLYDAVLHVPLIATIPGITKARRVSDETWTLDLAPTVAAMAGTRLPAEVQGRSFAHLLGAGDAVAAPPGKRDVVAETLRSAEANIVHFNPDGSARVPGLHRRAVRDGRWKLILSEPHLFANFSKPPPLPADAHLYRKVELYDLQSDPGETINLAATETERVEAMLAQLNQAGWR